MHSNENIILLLDKLTLVFGIISIILIIFEKRLGWLFASVASILSIILYSNAGIYLHPFLSLYYAIISLYGFILWKKHNGKELPLREYSLKTHLKIIFSTGFIAIAIALGLTYFSNANYPIVDSMVVCFSIVVNYMQVKKIVSNWLYWIILDAMVVVLDLLINLKHLSMLMLCYTLLAIVGYIRYSMKFKKQNKNNELS